MLRSDFKCLLPRLGVPQVCRDTSKGNCNTWTQKKKKGKSDVQIRSPPRMVRGCLVGKRRCSSSFCSLQIILGQKTWQPCSPHCSQSSKELESSLKHQNNLLISLSIQKCIHGSNWNTWNLNFCGKADLEFYV